MLKFALNSRVCISAAAAAPHLGLLQQGDGVAATPTAAAAAARPRMLRQESARLSCQLAHKATTAACLTSVCRHPCAWCLNAYYYCSQSFFFCSSSSSSSTAPARTHATL
jgi:hypothetical protein